MSTLINLLNLDNPNLLDVKQAFQENKPCDSLRFYHSYFLKRVNPKFYYQNDEKERLVKQANKHYQVDVERILAAAEQIVNRVFVFQEAWDMERTNIPVTFNGKIDWTHIPFEDPEWTYMFNRHRFLSRWVKHTC
jgi:hypothetical protein